MYGDSGLARRRTSGFSFERLSHEFGLLLGLLSGKIAIDNAGKLFFLCNNHTLLGSGAVPWQGEERNVL